jgi:GT2 family glycosyltransferase
VPSDDLPRVSVVVPVHNGASTLAGQLDALTAQLDEADFEVVVVDNRSTDATAEVALTYAARFPSVRLVRAGQGASVAYARNAGAAAATGDLLLFCDADDVVRPGWVRAMASALVAADLVGGRLDVTRINTPEVQSWTWHPPDDALAVSMKYLPYATGANLGVRRSVWSELDGFDETFVGGHEEVDFAWRAQGAGYTIAFVPDSVVDYRLRADRRGVYRQRFSYGRTYAQLYQRFRDHPIPRHSWKREAWVVAGFLLSGPREAARGHRTRWVAGVAWTLGRYRGDLAYRVRCPL